MSSADHLLYTSLWYDQCRLCNPLARFLMSPAIRLRWCLWMTTCYTLDWTRGICIFSEFCAPDGASLTVSETLEGEKSSRWTGGYFWRFVSGYRQDVSEEELLRCNDVKDALNAMNSGDVMILRRVLKGDTPIDLTFSDIAKVQFFLFRSRLSPVPNKLKTTVIL